MTKFLLKRPIAVGMTFLALLIFSVLAWNTLPVTLLPNIDVPQLAIRVNYPNASPEAIEANVLAPIRQNFAIMQGVKSMESKASSEAGMVSLQFEYGTRMDLAYVEANEKLDRLMDQFPREMERPQVIRVNSTDIPIIRVHVTPTDKTDMLAASALAENVLKKRMEQIEGISIVDINGVRREQIGISLKRDVLENLNLTDEKVLQSISQANQELGGIQVKDGQYQYYMRLASELSDLEDVRNIPVSLENNEVILLRELADIRMENQKSVGSHFFNTEQGIVLNIHKQAEAVMTEMMPEIQKTLTVFKEEYPQLQFNTSQDQSVFLNAGINNLLSSLLFGGLFAFVVLFLFMGNPRLPLIMGVSLPTSLVISFLFFKLFQLSINIISLSGLALGLGMLIDNAIIVLENISAKQKEGVKLLEACVQGVGEVRGALISSVLTTLAVFIPLIFLSGITGVLFYDQAVSVAIILAVSLGVAFVLLPLLYYLFFKGKQRAKNNDSRFFLQVLRVFDRTHHVAFKRPVVSLVLLFCLLPLGFLAFEQLDLKGMPKMDKNDAVLTIDWQEPIDLLENEKRINQLVSPFVSAITKLDSDIGVPQYLLTVTGGSLQQSSNYVEFESAEDRKKYLAQIYKAISRAYPNAEVTVEESSNAFELLFAQNEAYVRVKLQKGNQDLSPEQLNKLLASFPVKGFAEGEALYQENNVVFSIDEKRAQQYGIRKSAIITQLQKVLTDYHVTDIKSFANVLPIVLSVGEELAFDRLLKAQKVYNDEEIAFVLHDFVKYQYDQRFKTILSDPSGPYYDILLNEEQVEEHTLDNIRKWAKSHSLIVDFDGAYFDNQENFQQLIFIFSISVLLLYFILAAQFESFWQPLIVLLTLPLGVAGSLLFLWIFGASLNIMSGIGVIVMLGIMVNDAILKIDTMNRVITQNKGRQYSFYEALLKAGTMRLKPIIMTSITTLLALLPVLFMGGLGAELQKPLVLAVMGGLTIGTGTALYFVPLLYSVIKKNS